METKNKKEECIHKNIIRNSHGLVEECWDCEKMRFLNEKTKKWSNWMNLGEMHEYFKKIKD
jgi:hypothetical protein